MKMMPAEAAAEQQQQQHHDNNNNDDDDDDDDNTNNNIFIYTGNENGNNNSNNNKEEEVPITATHVRIHPTLTSIPARAFLGRTRLRSVEFHKHLQGIGEFAFGGCTSIASLTIPHGTRIGSYAFAGCTNLSDVKLLDKDDDDIDDDNDDVDAKIGTMAFYRCTSLVNINIPRTTTATTTTTPQQQQQQQQQLGGGVRDVVYYHDTKEGLSSSSQSSSSSSNAITIIGDASDTIWKRSWKRNRMVLIAVGSFVVVMIGALVLIGVMPSPSSGGGDDYDDDDDGKVSSSSSDNVGIVVNDDPVTTATGISMMTNGDDTPPPPPPSSSSEDSNNCVIVSVTLDDYPVDTSWNIQDLNNNNNNNNNEGTIIASSTPYNESMATSDAAIDDVKICLSNGEYSFTIFDEWGDGMCCNWGEGSYTVRSTTSGSGGGSGSGSGLLIIASGGEFERMEETTFSIPYGEGGPADIKQQQPEEPETTTAAATTAAPVKAPVIPTTCTTIEIVIVLDDYPLDTSWNIIDLTGKTVATSNSYDESMTRTTQVNQVCLINGSYNFVIYDVYEDGICCVWGQGGYILRYLSSDGGEEKVMILSGGEWVGPSDTRSFTIT